MKRIVLLPLVLLASLIPLGAADAAPAGPETNPVGTPGWKPFNTREEVPAGVERFVVVYDRSLNAQGGLTALLTKGAFGLKLASNSAQLRMVDHSSGVDSLDDRGGSPARPLDEVIAAVEGDVRDGACSKAGTASFSAAYSTSRSFLHPGSQPYQAQSGPGACEVVTSSVATNGGFRTTVTTFVPGFWIDVKLPAGASPTTGLVHNEIWYEAVYDTAGESGQFYQTADSFGQSKTIGDPPTEEYATA